MYFHSQLISAKDQRRPMIVCVCGTRRNDPDRPELLRNLINTGFLPLDLPPAPDVESAAEQAIRHAMNVYRSDLADFLLVVCKLNTLDSSEAYIFNRAVRRLKPVYCLHPANASRDFWELDWIKKYQEWVEKNEILKCLNG